MKKAFISSLQKNIKEVASDRAFLGVFVAGIVAMLVFAVYAGLTIEHRDIQVVARYSAFGEAHFYKEQWWSLYSFVLFGIVSAIVHAVAMVKLRTYGRRDLAMMFGWLTCGMAFIAFAYAHEVFRVAFI